MSYSNMQGVKQVKLKLKIKRVDVERLLVMASAALVVALALRGNENAVIRSEEARWEQGAATVAQPTLTPAETQPVTVYYQDGEGYLVPVTARVEKTDGIAKAALRLLVQSPDNDASAAREAFRLCREAGIPNISIDLIFGLSNLSDEVWENTIQEALKLGPEHISCYQLTVEGDNELALRLERGDYEEAPDEVCRHQYDILCEKLREAGYNHYEISNFAKPGFEAVHNRGYWQRRPYVGLGPSAHSFSGRGRSWNSPELENYIHTQEALSVEDEKVETLMLGLRTSNGVDAEFLQANSMPGQIDLLVQEGALLRQGRRYRIPEDHFFVSDEIIRQLI